eukprot:CAMPEP_0182446046 /NCGR_PEP_ID=MMETSP1172-20130603/3949_1 /TAXON_ID=708627 /ORGANISM="Timspurckia oligopyrenoides, Strain CCMP3278" /LENGTH=420 /DNA_ID=CAMNT_0024641911 /DNA_START=109 /DNA_END=1368 /DNA_ORIENTATION=+
MGSGNEAVEEGTRDCGGVVDEEGFVDDGKKTCEQRMKCVKRRRLRTSVDRANGSDRKLCDESGRKDEKEDESVIDGGTLEEVNEEEKRAEVTNTLVKLHASDVAGICGYNEYSEFGELVIKYVYQGLDELLEEDAGAVNLVLLTCDEMLIRHAQRAGAQHAVEILDLIEAARNGERVKSVEDTVEQRNRLKERIRLLKESKVLPVADVKDLEKLIQYELFTNFGTRTESSTLQEYQRMFGWEVYVPRTCYELQFPVFPAIESESSSTGSEPRMVFSVLGKVDGIVDVPVSLGNDTDTEEDWAMEQVVLEVKNRTRTANLNAAARFYEVIQLVVYLKMLKCNRGELVVSCREAENEAPRIKVIPVSLDDMHEQGWREEIVPRLTAFAQLVHDLRESTTKRRKFLAMTENEQLQFVSQILHW